ncbi:MAG: TonB-dependent receptor, partial [Xanthomonas perforans]|nr:TonB-dependent receptor [Xanthomonas perforans]
MTKGFNLMRRNRIGLGVSLAALTAALAMPTSVGAQAANIPSTQTPGTPAQTDPAPAQTGVVPPGTTEEPADSSAIVTPQSADPAAGGDADIIVTGFRRSLDAALNVKRDSVSAVDAIVAEDIAKFPDQN